MPYMRWDDFLAHHPRAHLLVGVGKGAAEEAAPGVLRGYVAALGPRGDYAVRTIDGTTCLAIETDYDTDRLKSELSAEDDGPAQGWASRRRFDFQILAAKDQQRS